MTVGVPAGFHPFMAQAVNQYHGRAANVDQQGGVGMPHIMHTNLLSAGVVTAVLHLSADPAPVVREDAVCRLYIVALCQIVFQTVVQHLRYDNLTVANIISQIVEPMIQYPAYSGYQ